MKDKHVSVEYFQIKSREYNNEGTLVKNNVFSINGLFKKAEVVPVKNRTWIYSDETARLQLVKSCIDTRENLKNCKNLWELQFVRIRKDLLPGIANDDGSYDPKLLAMYLNDAQGIAESVSAIYDDDLCVMVVQRNRDGILPSGIIDYFKNVSQDRTISYDAIDLDIDYSKLKPNYLYKKLELGLAELQPDTIINTSVQSLTNIIDGFISMGCSNTTLTLSVGNSRKRSMKSKDAIQSALDLSKDPHVKKLVIYTRESANSPTEEIDLLEKRVKDFFVLQYSKETPITHERVVNNLLMSYNKYRPLLLKRLKR